MLFLNGKIFCLDIFTDNIFALKRNHGMVYFKVEMLSMTYTFLFFKMVITNWQGRSNHIMIDTGQEMPPVRGREKLGNLTSKQGKFVFERSQ